MERDLKKLVASMTLEEKAGMCSGADFWNTKAVERLGIPGVMMSDGPHGIRKQEGEADHLGLNESVEAVCFPAACATASSFDVDLIRQMGEILGEECQAEDLSMLLGPAVNIKRSPLCGRNFEYFSEDPYLTGKMAAAYINGVQSWDVGTSIKHFAVNNQEYKRMCVSSEVSERAFREIYLPAFEEAVKEAQPKTVMCSYNKINGVFASENEDLLTKILRDEWGFEGYVVTDWGAVNDRVKGLKAGVDLEMPSTGGYNDKKIVEAVKSGELDEKVLNRAVERMLKVIFSYVDHRHSEAVFDRDKDHEKSVEIETECAVLLENNGVLPMKEEQKIVYIGEFAEKPRYQGGGSSHINSSKVVSALEAAQEKNRNVTYVKGFSSERDEIEAQEVEKAVQAAKEADIAVVFAGLPDAFESESYDRKDMKLPVCQNHLIEEVAKVQPNLVVMLHNGSPVETPWAEQTAAILELYLGGQGVGEACDRLLYGQANPSGRLAESFPLRIEDNPSYLSFGGDGKTVDYTEGVYVGYRYYEAKKQPVRWAFGHGLSYTEFKYDHLTVSSKELDDENEIIVEVDVTNVGACAGKEVVQLYVADKNGTVNRPVKELKGFTKLFLQPRETKKAQMKISARDLSFYNEEIKDWYAPSGTYEILIGHASDDIRISCEVSFTTKKQLPFQVTGTTTIGELLADSRTAAATMELLAPLQQNGENGEETSEADQQMIQAILEGLPLKSLSIAGVTGETIERIIYKLNELC